MERKEVESTVESIPAKVINRCLELLVEQIGKTRTAEELGLDPSLIESWLGKKEIRKGKELEIILLALRHSPEAKKLIKEIKRGFDLLWKGSEQETQKEKLENFLEKLTDEAKIIVAYCWRNQHAAIQELSTIISAPSDMYTLRLIKDLINPKSEQVFEKHALKFRKSSLDEVTGNQITYQWWFNLGLPTSENRIRKRVRE